ncbi:MAG TPA: DUF488 family protein [Acidobacteriaceae bacterium]|nr:DUF488 family protein [Acidobacteriaceae bacterium]
MAVSVVRLGRPRKSGEGLRIGTVRRPPRGVPKSEFAKRGFYDVWLPELSPSADLVGFAMHSDLDEKAWKQFERKYRAEMKQESRLLDLLAALSQQTDFSVGCYCEREDRCHRSILRKLLEEHGAKMEKRG